MPVASLWLTPDQRQTVMNIVITVADDRINLQLELPSEELGAFHLKYINFVYKSSGGATLVECEELKQDDVIDEMNALQVFIIDLKSLLFDRMTALESLTVAHFRHFVPIKTVLPHLKTLFASRTVQIENIRFCSAIMSTCVPIVTSLYPITLRKIDFDFRNQKYNRFSYDDFLPLIKSRTYQPLDLTFVVNHLSMENLTAIKKLTEHPNCFDRVEVTLMSIDQVDLAKFFAPLKVFGLCEPLSEYRYLPHTKGSQCFKVFCEAVERKSTESLLTEPGVEESITKVFSNRIIMTNILKKLQLFEIQALRKQSSQIRECIDSIKPDPQIRALSFVMDTICMGTFVVFQNFKKKDWANYFSLPFPELKEKSKVEFNTVKDDFSKILNPIDLNTRHQTSSMKELRLEFRFERKLQVNEVRRLEIPVKKRSSPKSEFDRMDFLENKFMIEFEQVLKRRKKMMKVEKLMMKTPKTSSIMRVLPHLDSVKIIEIRHPYLQPGWFRLTEDRKFYRNDMLSVDSISKLEQWRRAEELIINDLAVITPIRYMNLSNFAVVDLLVQNISSADMLYLKEELVKSSTFRKFKIACNACSIDNANLRELIGEPYRIISDVRWIWFFPIINSLDFLHIVYHEKNTVVLTRVLRRTVPDVIKNRVL